MRSATEQFIHLTTLLSKAHSNGKPEDVVNRCKIHLQPNLNYFQNAAFCEIKVSMEMNEFIVWWQSIMTLVLLFP